MSIMFCDVRLSSLKLSEQIYTDGDGQLSNKELLQGMGTGIGAAAPAMLRCLFGVSIFGCIYYSIAARPNGISFGFPLAW